VLTQTTEQKYQEVLQVAENLYRQDPDWVTFFREVLGIEGAARKAFPSFDALAAFEQSEEFDKIQKMLVKLREKRVAADAESEPTRVITVRLPKSMHEYLRTEAHDLRTSMNKLCISKLLQVIGEEMIPNERTGGSTSASSTPKPTTSVNSGMVAGRVTAPQSGSPAIAGSVYGTPSPQPQPHAPPFKPAQSRF